MMNDEKGLSLSRTIGGLAVLKVAVKDSAEALRILDSAIGYLKEKEPVPAEREGGGSSWWLVCGECHTAIDTQDQYCRQCGRRIDWNGTSYKSI